jgi:hypothetical protein
MIKSARTKVSVSVYEEQAREKGQRRTVLDGEVVDLLATSGGHGRSGRVRADGNDVEKLRTLLVGTGGVPGGEDALEVVAPETLSVHLDGNSCRRCCQGGRRSVVVRETHLGSRESATSRWRRGRCAPRRELGRPFR